MTGFDNNGFSASECTVTTDHDIKFCENDIAKNNKEIMDNHNGSKNCNIGTNLSTSKLDGNDSPLENINGQQTTCTMTDLHFVHMHNVVETKNDISSDLSIKNGYLDFQQSLGRCRVNKLKNFCSRIFSKCEASKHPLPPYPTKVDHLKRAFLCPPFGPVGAILLTASIFALWWGVFISVTKEDALPGGFLFPMFILFVSCWCGGYLVNLINLPPLFGMLITGGILSNVPYIDVGRNIDAVWSSTARNIALTVILIRAGLGLDPVALQKLSFVMLRLAFCPSIVEACTDAIATKLILGFPWTWAFMLAFVLSVVSPAVVVPSMLGLSDRGFGIDRGIPTLVVAAVSFDAVFAITAFGVCLGIAFSTGDLEWILVKGPLEAVLGIVFGCFVGFGLWYIPQRRSKNITLYRCALLFGGGLLCIFGSKYIKWNGAGPLACLSLAFIAGYRWRKEVAPKKKIKADEVMSVLWMIFQPLLFGLIGTKVDLSQLQLKTVGNAVAIIFLGLFFRLLTAFAVVSKSELSFKERLFISIAWFPKATVQAAIGGIALDTAIEMGSDDVFITLGHQILTIAVLSIAITAPVGSLLISLLGPTLLQGQKVIDGSTDFFDG